MTGTTRDALLGIDEGAWGRLADALGNADAPYRNVSLSTVDQTGHPQTRLVVVRAVDRARRTLEFHTDIRSPKWAELGRKPRICVLGYDPAERVQLRFTGKVTLHVPGTEVNNDAWSRLTTWTRQTYCGGPPGDALALPEPTTLPRDQPSEAETETGRNRFGVIIFTAATLDWFQHKRESFRRARFHYNDQGGHPLANWITP